MDSIEIQILAAKYLFGLRQDCPEILDAHLVVCRMKMMIESAVTLNAHETGKIGKDHKIGRTDHKRF